MKKQILSFTALLLALLLAGCAASAPQSGSAASASASASGAQPESALHAIIGLMIFATAALLAVSFYATYKFKLTRETHKVLLKEIARRKLGGNYRDCDEETRGVIKQLTGYEYDEVWGGSATQRATGRVSLSDAE